MKVLALETATAQCSVALLVEDRIVAARRTPMERGHAEALMPMVAAVIAAAAESGVNGIADLDLIAVTVGPGAFTGVRIGLSAARAMGLAAGLPVSGLTTLEVVAAAQADVGKPLLVALDTKRADIYVQLFGPGPDPLTDPQALPPADIAALLPPGPVALAGDAAAAAAAALAGREPPATVLDGPHRPEAAVLARLAASRWRAGRRPAASSMPRPLYLRPPDASPPRRDRRR